MKISKPANHKWFSWGGGGGKYQMQLVAKLPNGNIQTYQPQMINPGGGGGVNDQTQIVNTKLPNENIQTYQPQMIDSRGGGVNYQMQIVIKLPNGTTKVAQKDSEQPILPNSQLFQSFPTEVALKMTLDSQFCPIHNFSNLSPLKWLWMTRNGQFHLIHNFANLSPPEWRRMTQNGQFCLIHNFSNLFPPNDRFWGGWGVNDRTQIANTKLQNENIQFYQLQMIDSRGEG